MYFLMLVPYVVFSTVGISEIPRNPLAFLSFFCKTLLKFERVYGLIQRTYWSKRDSMAKIDLLDLVGPTV